MVALAMIASSSITFADAAAEAAKPKTSLVQAIPALEKLGFSLKTGLETEYVFRGYKIDDQSLQTDACFNYALTDNLGLYAGVWNNLPVHTYQNFANEVDFYAGVTASYKCLSFDAGYLYYWYPDGDVVYPGSSIINADGQENELKFGVSLDTSEWLGEYAVTPAATYYYNINYECSTLEGSLAYSAPISKWLFGGEYLSLDTKVYCGYRNFSKYAGVPNNNVDYMYAGFSSDFVVTITEYLKLSAGIRYSYIGLDTQKDLSRESNLWFGTSVGLAF